MNSVILNPSREAFSLNNWLALEHHLWKELKENSLLDQKILVGFSGGVDSLSLLWSLHRVKKTGIYACYVHHGTGGDEEYRDHAESFCRKFCEIHEIPFYNRKNLGAVLNSEAELRDFRRGSLTEVRLQIMADVLALAHHREDLLETRLLRLIRGTGPQGLMAMKVLQAECFRPFLKISKNDLKDYLKEFSLEAVQDPTNNDLKPLRNWLRQSWLADLENRQKGAVNSLARSLEILVETFEECSLPLEVFKDNYLSRPHYLALSKAQQKQALAQYLLGFQQQNFSQSLLEEIQKRLDNSQKELTFRIGGANWLVNAQQILVQKSE